MDHYCYDDDDAYTDTEIHCADNEVARLLKAVAEQGTAVRRPVSDCWI
jgi:hypothetical protein